MKALVRKTYSIMRVFVIATAIMSAAASTGSAADMGEAAARGEIKISNVAIKGNYVISEPCDVLTLENTAIKGVVTFGGEDRLSPIIINIGEDCVVGGLVINRPATLNNEGRVNALAVRAPTSVQTRGRIDLAVIEASCDLEIEEEADNPTTVIKNGSAYGMTGFISAFGDEYYAEKDGSLARGFLEEGGKTYYFDENRIRKTGFVSHDGKTYYLTRDGSLTAGWVEIGGKKYYFDSDGAMTSDTVKEIDGKRYWFDVGGEMKTGFMRSGDAMYCFLENGEMAVNTHIGDYRADGGGKLIYKLTGNKELDAEAGNILAKITNGDMTDREKMLAVYKWMPSNIGWRVTPVNMPDGYTQEKAIELALHAAKNRKGECEHFAALESILIQRLGYKTYCVSGQRLSTKDGTLNPHSWAMVEIDGAIYGFDPQYARTFMKNDVMSMFLISEEELKNTHIW
ncbi:MAG: hypothetical protein LBD49_00865 [Oscillospiraceae bacterium]|jgi:hypothetical protein|nr:hypothetical protein [Oscillospiraceae bacterium]